MIHAAFFAAGMVMGLCALVCYCCIRVGSISDDGWDDLTLEEEHDDAA